MTVFVANTNVIELLGLKSKIDGAYINDAAVTVKVYDNNKVAVAQGSWPLTMAYVAASSGNYRAILPDTLALKTDTDHVAYIEVNAGAGRVGHWEFVFKPTTRG